MRRADRLEMLLWAYPKTYRERRGEEIVGTLREGAPSHGKFESWRSALDVVAHGLRLRLGTSSDQVGGRVLAAGALPGMAMAGAAAAALGFFGFLLPGIRHLNTDFGPATAIWPLLYLVWLLGALGAVVFPRRKRILAAVCILVSIITMLSQPHEDWGWLPAISLLMGLTVPALMAPRTSSRRSRRGFSLLIGGACLGLLVALATAIHAVDPFGGPFVYTQFRTFAPDVAGLLALGVAVLVAFRRWIDATAIALLAVPWLVFGTLDQQAFRTPTFYALWVEVVCALAVGLAGTHVSRLKDTSEPAY